jgi:hypothetical protein
MTPRSHRMAWMLGLLSLTYVLTKPHGPSWWDVPVACAFVLAGWVLLQDVERRLVVTSDDAFARIVHPSAWSCEADDWPLESEEGVER